MLEFTGCIGEVLYILNYFYAIIIGLLITFPIGPGGLLCVQRTVKKGMKAGYLSAIGFITSDLLYGFIVLLGSTFIQKYISKDNLFINIAVSFLFLYMGIKLLRSKEHEIEDNSVHPLISGFLMGLANPGTMFLYIAVFHFFPISLGFDNLYYTIEILFCIFLGSNIFWFVLTELIVHVKKFFTLHHFFIFDKIIGGTITLFGVANIIKILISLKG